MWFTKKNVVPQEMMHFKTNERKLKKNLILTSKSREQIHYKISKENRIETIAKVTTLRTVA